MPPLSATTGRLRPLPLFGTSRGLLARSAPPRLGYNAAHGALLCAAELLGAEGPAEAGTAAHAMAAVETAARTVFVFDLAAPRRRRWPPPPRRLGSLRARDAAVGASDTYQAGTRELKTS